MDARLLALGELKRASARERGPCRVTAHELRMVLVWDEGKTLGNVSRELQVQSSKFDYKKILVSSVLKKKLQIDRMLRGRRGRAFNRRFSKRTYGLGQNALGGSWKREKSPFM